MLQFLLLALLAQASAHVSQNHSLIQDGPVQDARAPIELRAVPGTKIQLRVGPGFLRASTFDGFLNHRTNCSLMVIEFPGPYSEVSQGLLGVQPDNPQGLRVLSHREMRQGKYAGVFLEGEQQAGGARVRKCVWVFGDEQASVMVMGVCPAERVDEEFTPLSLLVQTAVWARDQEPAMARPTFSLTELGGMQQALRFSGAIGLTPGGQTGAVGPLFLCAPGIAPFSGEKERFAKRRVKKVADHWRFKLGPLEPVSIDGLQGYACHATAVSKQTKERDYVYVVTLFEGAAFWHMVGFAPLDEQEHFQPVFERVAAGFRREWTTLTTTDGQSQLHVPATWVIRNDIDEDAELQAGFGLGEVYAVLYTVPKAEFEDEFTLIDFSEGTRAWLEEESGSPASPKNVAVGGRPAIRCDFDYHDGEDPMLYTHVAIEGRESFHQLLLYAIKNTPESTLADFQRIVASFKELP